jgi:hypothetical protein
MRENRLYSDGMRCKIISREYYGLITTSRLGRATLPPCTVGVSSLIRVLDAYITGLRFLVVVKSGFVLGIEAFSLSLAPASRSNGRPTVSKRIFCNTLKKLSFSVSIL